MRTIIATFAGEGFTSQVTREVYADYEYVTFTADGDIDADGANGQSGAQAAYMADDSGSEYLANGGMKRAGNRVVFAHEWGRDIVLLNKSGNPRVLDSGVIPSKTAYRFPDKDPQDPAAYIDSETVPYIVVPPIIIQKTRGIVMGCAARVMHAVSGRAVNCIVADIGPRKKIGELSIAAARAIRVPHSPRHGGEDRPVLQYCIFPGRVATIGGVTYPLIPA